MGRHTREAARRVLVYNVRVGLRWGVEIPMTFRLIVNGKNRTVETEAERPLLEVLREDLGFTGVKYGCGEGQCRACTVLLDGKPVTSCLTPVRAAAGKKVTTIEG